MKNIPRIYIDAELAPGKTIPILDDTAHYLIHVMRSTECIVFGGGKEFTAHLRADQRGRKIVHSELIIQESTNRPDASNDLTLAFAPIKQARLEEMLNMATQMGVAKLQPVITDHTTAKNINWERIKKIVVEASEQSGRNSVPEIMAPISFADFLSTAQNLVFADERCAHGTDIIPQPLRREGSAQSIKRESVLIGPEGGFSDVEFSALDDAGAIGIGLGATILRAETAAVVALAKMI